ncbi:MAG: ATP-binding cassette domain-containing protein, partial [Leptospiraceae bacterium]|nr:ATP-binding cassette domain-containing protein [Leptospiraceae bacterium]
MIQIENLFKQFRGEGETITVLENLSLHIESGTIVSVEGASGEGKSTLLNIIGTMDVATSGTIRVGEHEITRMNEREKENFRAAELGFIFQHHYLLPDFTVLENVMMPLLIQRAPVRSSRDVAARMLDMVGLSHRLEHF